MLILQFKGRGPTVASGEPPNWERVSVWPVVGQYTVQGHVQPDCFAVAACAHAIGREAVVNHLDQSASSSYLVDN
jgi:hypothetical protein